MDGNLLLNRAVNNSGQVSATQFESQANLVVAGLNNADDSPEPSLLQSFDGANTKASDLPYFNTQRNNELTVIQMAIVNEHNIELQRLLNSDNPELNTEASNLQHPNTQRANDLERMQKAMVEEHDLELQQLLSLK